jgi:hypothetical protein
VTRFTWAIVAGVLVLVVGSLGLAVGLQSREQAPNLGTPEGVTLAYALALQNGDTDIAWGLLAESTRAQTSRERFAARASGFRYGDRSRLTVEDVHVDGDSARVDLVRTFTSRGGFLFASSPGSSHSTVRLTREPAGWRISTPPEPFLVFGP